LSLLCESCSIFHQNNQRIFLAGCLEALAALSILLHSPQQGACWLGQAKSLYTPTQEQRSLIPTRNAFYEATVATLQTLLPEETFATEFARGAALPREHVMREVQELSLLKAFPPSSASIEISSAHLVPIGLTAREREVLRLLAVGLSNREIAASLHVSQGTIRTHLSAIYSKLAVHSRTAAIHAAKVRGVL
jgi:ATP/maltotriose-dependent transcriptional regulator MalT